MQLRHMEHTYKVSGMTCDHCVQMVRKTLESIDGVESVVVTLEPPRATLTMHHHVATNTLNDALQAIGDYRISEAHTDHVKTKANKEQPEVRHSMDHSQHGPQKGNDQHMHHDHHRMMIQDFKKRLWVSLILTLPVLLLSPMIQSGLGVSWSFNGDSYLLFALSSMIYFYGGYPFLNGLLKELKQRASGMMTLIAVAISAAYLYSSAVVFGLEGKRSFGNLLPSLMSCSWAIGWRCVLF